MPESARSPVVSTLAVPLMLLSGILLLLSGGPRWLDALSRVNPLRYAVDAVRDLFAGDWNAPTVPLGLAVTVGFAVVSAFAGVRLFERRAA